MEGLSSYQLQPLRHNPVFLQLKVQEGALCSGAFPYCGAAQCRRARDFEVLRRWIRGKGRYRLLSRGGLLWSP